MAAQLQRDEDGMEEAVAVDDQGAQRGLPIAMLEVRSFFRPGWHKLSFSSTFSYITTAPSTATRHWRV